MQHYREEGMLPPRWAQEVSALAAAVGVSPGGARKPAGFAQRSSTSQFACVTDDDVFMPRDLYG
eukprot:CAMPEP_0117496598 /NCGR_PEP_ID=MMETSP0784-20121206/20741_1 /TAXON_ID=39447 /ORGANISM="" /LENGTH=63 /DNA_ID=CAMNT_0005291577 /DNA_START=36 /DNA_END=225 /DNA_ORIENTATION=+